MKLTNKSLEFIFIGLLLLLIIIWLIYDTDDALGTLAILAFSSFMYFIGVCAAHTDRRAEITDINLDARYRALLFLNQQNPFRKKTIIYQKTLLISSSIAILLSLILSNIYLRAVIVLIHLLSLFIIALVFDIRLRRKHLDK